MELLYNAPNAFINADIQTYIPGVHDIDNFCRTNIICRFPTCGLVTLMKVQMIVRMSFLFRRMTDYYMERCICSTFLVSFMSGCLYRCCLVYDAQNHQTCMILISVEIMELLSVGFRFSFTVTWHSVLPTKIEYAGSGILSAVGKIAVTFVVFMTCCRSWCSRCPV